MTKRTEKRAGAQAGNGGGARWAEVLAPLVAGMTATRASLLEWVHAHGLVALQAVFKAEADALAGPKGQHDAGRTHHRWGATATELTFGGRRLQVARPRVRSLEGQEAVLPSVAAAGSADGASAGADRAGRVGARVCRQPRARAEWEPGVAGPARVP